MPQESAAACTLTVCASISSTAGKAIREEEHRVIGSGIPSHTPKRESSRTILDDH